MPLNPGEKVIDNLDDVRPPQPSGFMPRDFSAVPYGAFPFGAAFPTSMEIAESNWSAAIKEMVESKSLLTDLWQRDKIKPLHQQQTSLCWMFCVICAVKAIRAKMGLPPLDLSPASAGLPCYNFQDNGGWSTKGVAWVAEHGVNTEEEWGGSQTKNSRALYTEANKTIAKTRVITEWWDVRPRNFKQQISCAILGIPVACGFNRLGHAICQMDPVEIEPGSFGVRFRDSYGDEASWCDGKGCYVMRSNIAGADDAIAPRVVSATTK